MGSFSIFRNRSNLFSNVCCVVCWVTCSASGEQLKLPTKRLQALPEAGQVLEFISSVTGAVGLEHAHPMRSTTAADVPVECDRYACAGVQLSSLLPKPKLVVVVHASGDRPPF